MAKMPAKKIRKLGGKLSPPKGYPKQRKEYAIPGTFQYPLDTEKHVRAALGYFPKHEGKYSAAIRKAAYKRIFRAAKKFGIEVSEDVLKRAK